MPDDADDLIDIGDGNRQTDQHMRPLARLAQQVFRATADDIFAEGHESTQHVEQRHLLGLAAVQRHHVAAKRGLQRCVAVKLVQDDVCIGVALQFDDDAITLAVGFVAQVGNALDALFLDQLSHFFDHRCLVHLIGNFGDDDLLAVATHRLDCRAATHDDRSAARFVSRADAGTAHDQRTGREIRARNDLHQFRQLDRRIVDQGDTAIDNL